MFWSWDGFTWFSKMQTKRQSPGIPLVCGDWDVIMMWPMGRSVQCHGAKGMSDDVDLDWDQSRGPGDPPVAWPRYDAGPCECCPCHELPMSCPMSHVSSMGPGQETSQADTRAWEQYNLRALSCLQRRASLPWCRFRVNFVWVAQTQIRPRTASAVPGVHRTQEGEGRCCIVLCSQLSDWLEVAWEASYWLVMTPCLLWAPQHGTGQLHDIT